MDLSVVAAAVVVPGDLVPIFRCGGESVDGITTVSAVIESRDVLFFAGTVRGFLGGDLVVLGVGAAALLPLLEVLAC